MTKKCVLSEANVAERKLVLDGVAYRSKAYVQEWADLLDEAGCDIPVVAEFFTVGKLSIVTRIDFDTEPKQSKKKGKSVDLLEGAC